MSISATEPVGSGQAFGAAAVSGTSGATTTTSTSAGKDMFLQLLVAQMKYQDPLNPTDSGEFLAQSAQFTALEKMQDVADQVAILAGSQAAFGASGLIGRQVSWTAPDGSTGTGTVESVRFAAEGPVLSIGGSEVPLGSVTSVDADGFSSGAGAGNSTGTGTSSGPGSTAGSTSRGSSESVLSTNGWGVYEL